MARVLRKRRPPWSLLFRAFVLALIPQVGFANVVCDFEPSDAPTYQVTILSEMDPFQVMELNRQVDPLVVYLPLEDRFELETGTGRVVWQVNQKGMAVSFATANRFHLVSLWPDGSAHLAAQSAQSSSVSLGSCQVV